MRAFLGWSVLRKNIFAFLSKMPRGVVARARHFLNPADPARTMISYLLNALSATASTASGTPGNAEELRRGGDVSPRCVADVENKTGNDDGAAGCTGGDGPTPSHDGNSLTSREVKTNNKSDKTKEYVEGDGSETKVSPEVMAVTPDGKKQPSTDGVATNAYNDERMDTDKIIVADVDDTSGIVITKKKQGDKGPIENGGKKKRKRGGTGSRLSSSVTTPTPAATNSDVNKNMNHPVQNHGSELSILPKTTALSTQLQIHAALMSTRSAIRRAYTHSHLGGIILISSSRGTFNRNAGIVTGRNNTKRGNDDIGGHCILAIRYCGFKDSRDGTIEIEYARTGRTILGVLHGCRRQL